MLLVIPLSEQSVKGSLSIMARLRPEKLPQTFVHQKFGILKKNSYSSIDNESLHLKTSIYTMSLLHKITYCKSKYSNLLD